MNKINLYNIGLTERYAQEATMYGDNLFLARISIQHKDMYKVITEGGEINAKVSGKLGYSASASAEYPAVGDWVLVDRTDEKNGYAIIHYILTRKSCFERKAAGTGHERQIIAANIDTVFICMSLNKDYNLRRIERYLSIAWDSMAIPVIVLTKSDLCEDINDKLVEIESVAPGVDVVVTSCMNDGGYTDLLMYFDKGKTIAFIGSSGVGKSTLINRLMGEEVLATKEIRGDGKGRHTTTHRQLLMLPDGGVVIDTPGMRELQVLDADLTKSFNDIEKLAEGCYFRDCRHESEPGCAVRKAIEDGTLSAGRYENYKKLQREMVFEERKNTMTAARAQKQKMIDMIGSLETYKQLRKNIKKNKGNR
ncbi:ribosome small subunit-dependent GTPase A [Pelotomaculum isophthalicicum JI]|uniref:Small ribosomal subunit biogenesis GTPase RsgA n=1 Tax=Pelotomaculum isophthalicicum JI TaxID=947010 RepID=A0A9X4H7Y1_9FIRM|nr:ribosome small subunit-dependent GTPase A [Pelotomaculum isophthalicicum]MDF9408164.1 ribosome small subunit-dependent GTPase A [Pelotomaculum isophthalicicum JI]